MPVVIPIVSVPILCDLLVLIKVLLVSRPCFVAIHPQHIFFAILSLIVLLQPPRTNDKGSLAIRNRIG